MSSQRLTDLMQSTASEGDIRFYFITKSGTIDEASADLKYSFETIASFSSSTENLQWLSEADCLHFDKTLNKQNIFVFEVFEGPAFEHLSLTKAIVLGPKILINCQLSNDVVPNIASPMFTLAMKNLIVCLSGIAIEKRAEIHKLVGFMGGLWTKDLIESTTHLITNTIQSQKYEKASMRNMKIMKEEWIYEVWNLSKIDDNSYATEEFEQKYKLPIFHNLVITSTGISEADKNEIIQSINCNGGTYSGSFKSKLTNILITQSDQKNSEKFKAAVKCRKECLMVDWVKDSVKKGFALPYVNYRIYTGQKSRTNVVNSTQISNRTEKSDRTDIFNADSTQLSAIMSDYSIAETTSAQTPMKESPPKRAGYKKTLDQIDISLVKKAMGCLDGCTIWLCGFDGTDVEKLKKIINIGGAIRIDEHGPNVEYVIVGKPSPSELSTIQSLEGSNIVTVDWLVACISAKGIADPKDFVYRLKTSNSDSVQTVPSPASRKNIEAMKTFRRPDYVPRHLNLNKDEDKIKNRTEKTLLEQYAQPSVSHINVQREETGTETMTEESAIDPNLFRPFNFALFGFSEESTLELSGEIEEAGGSLAEVNDSSKSLDYLVVPGDVYDFSDCHYKAKETITDFWVQDCLTDNKLVDIQYFHRAIILRQECKPLQGLNIVFSTYTTPERDYLYSLARALGGDVNDRYMRNQSPILICPTPDGKKYLGAIKWKLPVVSSEWLRKCLEEERKVPMSPFAVGDSKCGEDDNEENFSDRNSSGTSDKMQKMEKPKKMDGSDTSNRNDLNEEVTKAADVNVNENATPITPATPAQHPRIWSIKNNGRQANKSPKTPLSSNAITSGGERTPITEFVEDLTPETRQIVYAMYKSTEENTTPLTKRRRLENVTDSPLDPTAMDPPDVWEHIDRNFIEIPKTRPSTPFVEYRKRMYKEFLGDKYDGTPLRVPLTAQTSALPSAQPHVTSVDDAEPNTSRKDTETRGGDGSTQVREFFNSIKKCRDSRPSHTTIQLSKCKLNDSSEEDNEEELTNDPPQQIEIIDWRDPEDFFQSERFSNGSRSSFKGTMRFSMSLTIAADQEEVKKRIVQLGGTMCEELSGFDPSCTHLICSNPNQSEKTLSIIASGRWLLCPAYIEDSHKAGHFLSEEDYEWGNPVAKAKLPSDVDAKSNKIAMVSHKWRKELQLKSKMENKPVGIFSGFRAILHSKRKDSFKRLLEAGCGVVVDIEQPYAEKIDFQGVTHCFVDKRMAQISESDKAAMKAAGVHCVTILYLQACLQEDTLPSVKDYAAK